MSGQKVWTSYAMVASKCFCYVRTDRDAPRHRGISVLIIDLDSPGIEIRPLRHLAGHAEFAEVFFDAVQVPRENLVGELNGGWRITMGSLAHERGGLWVEGVAGCLRAVDDIVAMVGRLGLQRDAGITARSQAVLPIPQPAGHGLEGLRVVRPGQQFARALLHESRHVRIAADALRAGYGCAG
ncbi:MAG: acyl-CoA dehydrogenase family protein [Halioglobus sp.]